MNASDTTTYPMPATDCPRWCLEDHLPSWQAWVSTALNDTPIPAAGGGFLPTDRRTPVDEWLAQWAPYHRSPVVLVKLDEGDEHVVVDLARYDGSTSLYVDGQGSMTAEQARRLAAGLLDAAAALDRVTQ